MNKTTLGRLAILIAAMIVAAGWVLQAGDRGTTFDLADLADGETRVFGSDDKQVTVTRRGDIATIEHAAATGRKLRDLQCALGTDSCKITSFDNGRLRMEIEKRRGQGEAVEQDHDVFVFADAGDVSAHEIVIEKILECEGEECDHLELMHGIPEGAHVMINTIRCEGEDDCEEFEWTSAGGADSEIVISAEDADAFDLAELLDGETKIFGFGEKQLTAVRSGDRVSLSRPAYGDKDALSLDCDVSRDSCQVIVPEEGDHVMVKIEKRRVCRDGEGDCDKATRTLRIRRSVDAD